MLKTTIKVIFSRINGMDYTENILKFKSFFQEKLLAKRRYMIYNLKLLIKKW
jgi:hypothetical protein